ncbi:MAG: hypothetical protein ABR874_10835 [Candidatus Sulfotelmatobacter sp.]|jgi:hypothetical protein
MKINIEQVESSIAEELDKPLKAALKRHGYPIHESFRLRLSLLNADGRKKRSNAVAHAWAPEKSEPAQFWLEPSTAKTLPAAAVAQEAEATAPASEMTSASVPRGASGASTYVHPAEAELLRALDRAESTPGWSFVSLKKFRDEILPTADVPSIRSDVERQSVLRSAIDKRLILKKPVPNPKSPQFPVTSIRLNRLLPEVQEVLGTPKRSLDFHPIHIKGEPLSATILRERR